MADAAIIGGGMGIFSTFLNNLMAKGRETSNRAQEYNYNEMAANNAEQRLRERYTMYQNPEAMLKQYKDAGLSPSLMYENGGGGTMGSSAAQGGVSGMQPQIFPYDPMLLADIKLKEAQARNLNVDSDTKEGVNERGAMEIKKLGEELKSKELTNAGQEIQNGLIKIEEEIKQTTKDDEIGIKKYTLMRLMIGLDEAREELRSLKVKARIDEKTEQSTIKLAEQQVRESIARVALINAQRELAKKGVEVGQAQIDKLINDISVANDTVALGEANVEVNQDRLNAQVQQWATENGIAKSELVIKAILGTMTNMVKLMK